MFDPDDFRGSDNVRCACGSIHPPNYRLIHCAERTCEAVGCFECFPRCEVSDSCGRFCDQHINEIEMGTPERPMKVHACVRCEAMEIDAAPDMYEALKFVYDHIADPERDFRDLYPAFGLNASTAVDMVRSAIAKAEGRT